MKKTYNAVASEYEMPQLTPEPRYLKCETITDEWWYKDMKTGEDLPKYATPIEGLDTLTFNQEKVFNDFAENVIDPIDQCQKLQKIIDKVKENAKEKIKGYESYIADLKKGNYPSSTIKQERQELIFRIREQEELLELLQGEDNE